MTKVSVKAAIYIYIYVIYTSRGETYLNFATNSMAQVIRHTYSPIHLHESVSTIVMLNSKYHFDVNF